MDYIFSDNIKALKPSAIREILKLSNTPGMIPFSAGNPSVEAFPIKAVEEISANIFKNDPITALQYSVTEGYAPLKQTLIDYLSKKYDLVKNGDELIITAGAQQAISLSSMVLCNKDDTIVCEDPSFIGSLNAFRANGLKLKGVKMDSDGVNIEALEKAFIETKAKVFYTIPNFQNPSGITMSLSKRKAVLELAVKYGVVIIEDNPYGELRFNGEDIPSIKFFDKTGNVIYVGSFSKVLSPGMRVGYCLANEELIKKIVVCKQTSDVHTNIWAQMVADRFMNDYDFEAHLKNLREIYAKKANFTMELADKYLNPNITYQKVDGGLFLWCKLPEKVNMPEFCKYAVENGVATVPGTAFLCDTKSETNYFRINFSTPSNSQIEKGIKKLGEFIKKFI